MKIAIAAGHTLKGKGSGAVGILNESVEVRKIAKEVSNLLKQNGQDVLYLQIDKPDSYNGENYKIRVNKANSWGAKLYVEIHLNSSNSNAYGTEVYTWKGEEVKEARNILNNICSLGYRNRGIKNGSIYYVIKHTRCNAFIVECFFCNSMKDANLYNVNSMAKAIASGILGHSVSTSIAPKVTKQYSVNYILEFQKWYNATTKTKAPLKENGVFGVNTAKALNTLERLLKKEY